MKITSAEANSKLAAFLKFIKGPFNGALGHILRAVKDFFASPAAVLFLATDKGYMVLDSDGCPLESGACCNGNLSRTLEGVSHPQGGQWHLVNLCSSGKSFGVLALYGDKWLIHGEKNEAFLGLLSQCFSQLLGSLIQTQQLLEEKGLYKAALENASSPLILGDTNGRIIHFNDASARLYGWKREEVLGKEIGSLFDPLRKSSFSFIPGKLDENGPLKFTEIGLKRDGSRLVQEFAISLLKDEDNRSMGLVASVSDVTETVQKRLCEEVAENINIAITSSLNKSEITEAFAKELNKVVDFDGLELMLLEKATAGCSAHHHVYPPSRQRFLEGMEEWLDFVMNSCKKASATTILEGSPLGNKLHSKGIHSYLLYSVDYLQKIRGILFLYSKRRERFRRGDERRVLAHVAPQTILAIYNAEVYDRLKANLYQLQELCRITSELMREVGSPNNVFEKVTQGAATLFKNSGALLCLSNFGPTPQVVASYGLSREFIEKFSNAAVLGCSLGCNREGPVYLYTPDTEKGENEKAMLALLKAKGLEAMLSAPIRVNDKNVGCINIFFPTRYNLEDFQLKLLEMFTNEVAVALNNVQIYKRLQESEELYKELYDQAPCMYYSLSKSGIILKCNNTGAQSLDYRKEELHGRHIFNFLEEGSVSILRSILKGELFEGEVSFVKKGGDILHATIRACQADSSVGREVRVVLTDITEKKRLHGKLSHVEKLRTLGQLTSGIAHDFNNFLTVILGNTYLMQEKCYQSKELQKCLGVIKKAALDGAQTVRRLREFTSIRADISKLMPVNVHTIVKDVINYTRPRWRTLAQVRGITYRLILKKAIREGWVMGNPSELKEVFLNIIDNAFDAMPGGGKLTIKIHKEAGKLSVSIKDTGVGMSEEVKKKVFDPFFTTKGIMGSGLGMSVAYAIITQHGGDIKLESQEGKGTTVIVKLPLHYNYQAGTSFTLTGAPGISYKENGYLQVPHSQRLTSMCSKPRRSKLTGPSKDASGLRVLIIDDEEETCKILTHILLDSGHDVTAITKGKIAMKALNRGSFDVVCCDLAMHGLTGWDVAAKIKQLRLIETSPLPVLILVTGLGTYVEHGRLKEAGVDYVLNKPFLAEEVLEVVGKAQVMIQKIPAEYALKS